MDAAAGLRAGPDCARGDALVVVFLRGAADTLNLVVPHGETAYYARRPALGIPRPDDALRRPSAGALDLDGFFGLHPSWRRCCRPGRPGTWRRSMPAARPTRAAATSAPWR